MYNNISQKNLNIERIVSIARNNTQNGLRNATMILIMYRCGLSINQLLFLRWKQIDIKLGLLYIKNSSKNGIDIMYPLFSPELRALQKIQQKNPNSQYVFLSKYKKPITASSFRQILKDIIIKANIDIHLTPSALSIYRKKYLTVGDNYMY